MTVSASPDPQQSLHAVGAARLVRFIPYIDYNWFHNGQCTSYIRNAPAAHTLVKPILQPFVQCPRPCPAAALKLYGKVGRS